jgi:phosphoribosylanthranilate isomerase
MVHIKICGIKNLEDLFLVDKFGPDFVGFVMYPPSPRYTGERLSELLSTPTKAKKVVVFVNPTYEEIKKALNLGAEFIQLHGDEDLSFAKKIGMERVIKAFRVRDDFRLEVLKPFAQAFALILDAYDEKAFGGTGKIFNWEIAKEAVKMGYRIFLAGGLNPENVALAVKEVNPFGVDLASGLELYPGKKDPKKVEKLFAVLKGMDPSPLVS